MKNVLLSICDWDEVYLNRLNGFIQHQERSPFLIKTYTELGRAVQNAEEKGIFLVNGRMLPTDGVLLEEACSHWGKIVINDEKGDGFRFSGSISNSLGANLFVISKYQSAREVFEYLIKNCTEAQDSLFAGTPVTDFGSAGIIGIYTPEDKGLQNVYSLNYARKASASKRCLYISFEEFSAEDLKGGGMSELICLIKGPNPPDFSRLEECMITEENLQRIPAPACPYDLKEVRGEEWCEWIEKLAASKRYGEIVINFGNMLPDPEILELCTRVLMPCTAGSKRKCDKFRELMVFMGKEKISEKTEIMVMEG